MAQATAPSPEEIRMAIFRRWHDRRRDALRVNPDTSLANMFTDGVLFYLYSEVMEELHLRDDPGELRGPWEETYDAVMLPVMADVERQILEGMATALERCVAG